MKNSFISLKKCCCCCLDFLCFRQSTSYSAIGGLISLFKNFKGTKPLIFARDPILFFRLFEKASKNLNHINFAKKVHHSST